MMLMRILILLLACVMSMAYNYSGKWQSAFVKVDKKGRLKYIPDEKGNTIPDFSRVGYYRGDKLIPQVKVIKTIGPSADAQKTIQDAIDEVSRQPLRADGFRGTILLKKGRYEIPGSIQVRADGIVLRGEGDETQLIATGTARRPLISVNGKGSSTPDGPKIKIADSYVPVGSFSFNLESTEGLMVGDHIILQRPGTANWIHDLKMDQIDQREGTKQWQASEYNLQFERTITKIRGRRIFIDNPVVVALDANYGGGEVYEYQFSGRISHVAIENLQCESAYTSDTAENHAWDAIHFNRVEHGWIQNVTARHFAFACVNLGAHAKFITVRNCRSLDPKSNITGGRRYSFNNDGQMNLFMDCEASGGRHDYVTGAKVAGPNVFYNCKASNTHADIGPHHRWAVGTLYDNIVTDGEINVQDRGNWGTGHGWAGVTQVIWNCTAKRAAVQSPWVSGKNYCIGLKGEKYAGRLPGRPDAEWEGLNFPGLVPGSLYVGQLKARGK